MKYLGVLLVLCGCGQGFQTYQGDTSIITGVIDDKLLTITSSAAQAGVISSITWDGVEFVDPTEHGASMQSASSYDSQDEYLNPTEAGSLTDDANTNPSTSVLLYNTYTAHSLATIVQAAYWTGGLSPDLISKQLVVGAYGLSNVISYNVQFTVHDNHVNGVFEALTGYMPANFTQYFVYHNYVIYCDTNLKHCMGGYAFTPNTVVGSWGDQRQSNNATKWNLVWYVPQVPAGVYSYQMAVIIGTYDEVQNSAQVLGRLTDK